MPRQCHAADIATLSERSPALRSAAGRRRRRRPHRAPADFARAVRRSRLPVQIRHALPAPALLQSQPIRRRRADKAHPPAPPARATTARHLPGAPAARSKRGSRTSFTCSLVMVEHIPERRCAYRRIPRRPSLVMPPAHRPACHEIAGKFRSSDCFSALHACQPLAGLRSSGKGANRTILDCVFHLFGRDKWSFCRRGGRGRRQPLRAVRYPRAARGGSTGCR